MSLPRLDLDISASDFGPLAKLCHKKRLRVIVYLSSNHSDNRFIPKITTRSGAVLILETITLSCAVDLSQSNLFSVSYRPSCILRVNEPSIFTILQREVGTSPYGPTRNKQTIKYGHAILGRMTAQNGAVTLYKVQGCRQTNSCNVHRGFPHKYKTIPKGPQRP